ncbi:MAG: hypothetical protein JWR85_1679 [Marmoricola sp.]|nr:hypothetical protein [Marmoricola sp.]
MFSVYDHACENLELVTRKLSRPNDDLVRDSGTGGRRPRGVLRLPPMTLPSATGLDRSLQSLLCGDEIPARSHAISPQVASSRHWRDTAVRLGSREPDTSAVQTDTTSWAVSGMAPLQRLAAAARGLDGHQAKSPRCTPLQNSQWPAQRVKRGRRINPGRDRSARHHAPPWVSNEPFPHPCHSRLRNPWTVTRRPGRSQPRTPGETDGPYRRPVEAASAARRWTVYRRGMKTAVVSRPPLFGELLRTVSDSGPDFKVGHR